LAAASDGAAIVLVTPQQVAVAERYTVRLPISLGTFVVLLLGIVLWLAYGVLLGDAPLIVSNGITLVLAGSILVFKLRYG
jgi:MtN3 and saliva related transmembrane protein